MDVKHVVVGFAAFVGNVLRRTGWPGCAYKCENGLDDVWVQRSEHAPIAHTLMGAKGYCDCAVSPPILLQHCLPNRSGPGLRHKLCILCLLRVRGAGVVKVQSGARISPVESQCRIAFMFDRRGREQGMHVVQVGRVNDDVSKVPRLLREETNGHSRGLEDRQTEE